MGMGNNGDINPSAENMASELFYIIDKFFSYEKMGVRLVNIRLYETPNCWVDASDYAYSATDAYLEAIKKWRSEKGDFNYDIRNE